MICLEDISVTAFMHFCKNGLLLMWVEAKTIRYNFSRSYKKLRFMFESSAHIRLYLSKCVHCALFKWESLDGEKCKQWEQGVIKGFKMSPQWIGLAHYPISLGQPLGQVWIRLTWHERVERVNRLDLSSRDSKRSSWWALMAVSKLVFISYPY